MRIAWLSLFCLVACTGPGAEPPVLGGEAGAFSSGGRGGENGSGAGGANGGMSGSAGMGGSGGRVSPTGGQGGVGGMSMSTGGMIGAGQGGDGDMDGGASDAEVPDSGEDIEMDPTRDLDTGWSDACGDVTNSGHCVGDVYEYCDYFTRGLKQLDCGARGMTCQAGLQPGDSVETNGCVGEPCTVDDEVCEDNFRVDCHDGHLLVTDCHKLHGPESACELYHDDFNDSDYIRCARDQPCDTPNVLWCDQELEVVCDEEGKLYLIDCQAHALDGRCVVPVNSEPYCDPSEHE